jgi:hypothetical protein
MMNKRILKLFMQACQHADYEHQNVPKELVEKFTELVVRECARVMDNADSEGRLDGDYAMYYLGEHFGVEE